MNGVTYVSGRGDVDAERVGFWGINYAGGHVLPVAALDPRVKVLFSIVPVLDGWYNPLRANSNVGLRKLWEIIRKERFDRIATGKHGTIAHSAHPQRRRPVPRARDLARVQEVQETVAPNHEHWTTIQSCEFVLSYDVTPYVKRIIHQPTLMVTSWYDDITMTEFEVPAFHTIPSPRKKARASRRRPLAHVAVRQPRSFARRRRSVRRFRPRASLRVSS